MTAATDPLSPTPYRPELDAHVVLTFDLIDPDAGSEPGIAWNWLTRISERVRAVTAVVPDEAERRLSGDPRLPVNARLVGPANVPPVQSRLPIPRWYRSYATFRLGANEVVRELEADIAHQATLGTPYWGSAIDRFRGPRLLGPVGVSAPAPPRIRGAAGPRDLAQEAVRSAILRWPKPPVTANGALDGADHVLAVDQYAARLARKRGRPVSMMMQDGAEPVPLTEIVPPSERADLLWVGRFAARKGAELAVRAMALASDRLPADTRLVVVGDGPSADVIEREVRRHNVGRRIELVGRLPHDETLKLVSTARALVFSSLRDTFGGVVLEAAERGTPCVTVLHQGVSGLQTWWPTSAGWAAGARTPGQFVRNLAEQIVAATTCDDSAWASRSVEAYRFAQAHRWDDRATRMVGVYRSLIAHVDR